MKQFKKILLLVVVFLFTLILSSCSLIQKLNNKEDENEDETPTEEVETYYYVTFDGSDFQSVKEGEKATSKSAPAKEGYTFNGWYLNDELFDFDTAIYSDINLVSKYYINSYVVKFYVNGTEESKQIVEYGKTVTKPANDPTSEGFKFLGWYLNDEEFDFNSIITEDIILNAKFNYGSYTVTFNNDGNKEDVAVEQNSCVTKPTDPTKKGYTFSGWYLNDELYDFSSPITKAIELVAKFEVTKITVIFYVDSSKTTVTINYNELVSKPTDPVKTGYTFIGWYTGGNEFDFNNPITSNTTLYAKFDVETFTITFNDQGSLTSVEVDYNKKVTEPHEPSLDGYFFDGWFNGDTLFDFNTKITQDYTLVAKYTLDTINKVFVTYDFGYECYQTKDDLRVAYYTDFYNFLKAKNYNFAYYGITDITSFLDFMDTWTYGNKSEMRTIGDAFGSYYVTIDVDGKLEDQPTSTFIGYCYQNGKYVDFIKHLMTFFAYWRTDEGYSQNDPHGNDFFASNWASMVDTAKFFHFTSSNLRDTYSWFNSSRVDYALDHIPGVGYVTLTYKAESEITLPSDVTRDGYEFLGWYDKDGNKITKVTSSMTVYAHWASEPVFTIKALGGNTYVGSSTNYYYATNTETQNGYLYGIRLIIAKSGDNYVVSNKLSVGTAITETYEYRIVLYNNGYQDFDSAIEIGQIVKIETEGDYLIFKFYKAE